MLKLNEICVNTDMYIVLKKNIYIYIYKYSHNYHLHFIHVLNKQQRSAVAFRRDDQAHNPLQFTAETMR